MTAMTKVAADGNATQTPSESNSPKASVSEQAELRVSHDGLRQRVRLLTASSLFDGHDASINIIRRLLQRAGAEVIHLGHNRSVAEIVEAAIQEDVGAVAVSSYQGGHNEFFRYMVDMLRAQGGKQIKIFGGGGGVMTSSEILALEKYGVTRIYSPEVGRKLGLEGIIQEILEQSAFDLDLADFNGDLSWLDHRDFRSLARLITLTELEAEFPAEVSEALERRAGKHRVAVVGITGPGGAGKSSLIDELIRRILRDYSDIHVGIVSVDPSRRKTGGALLGDRIRMNAVHHPRVFMRSLATRNSGLELATATGPVVQILKAAQFDLIVIETSGIGQGDSAVTDVSDLSVYIMTTEYGANSQLEKIEMLDLADLVAINKADRRGGEDALRAVRKQIRRNMDLGSGVSDTDLPVFCTVANQFDDDGLDALYMTLLVLRRSNSFTKSFDLCEDGICRGSPGERGRVGVPVVGEALDSADQLLHLTEGAASNGALGDDVEPDLDLVEPGSVGRREVDVETWMFGQPHFDLGVLVGPVVVDDDVEVQVFGDVAVNVA